MLKWLLLGVGVYGVLSFYMYATQEKQLFNARAIPALAPFTCKGCEEVALEPAPQVLLKGKHRPNPQGPLVLYFGGNADDATRIFLHLDLEAEVVAFNYRGYVDSSGFPSEKNLFHDALFLYDTFAKDRDVVVVGRSLGTGVATYLASKRPVVGVVLITPFDSIRALAKASYPFLPIDWLLKHPFDSDKHMALVQAPVFLLEVEGDRVTPKAHLEALKKKIIHLGAHVVLQGTTHGEVLKHEAFSPTLATFLEQL